MYNAYNAVKCGRHIFFLESKTTVFYYNLNNELCGKTPIDADDPSVCLVCWACIAAAELEVPVIEPSL